MEANSVVEPLVDQSDEVFARFGSMFVVQFQDDLSLRRQAPLDSTRTIDVTNSTCVTCFDMIFESERIRRDLCNPDPIPRLLFVERFLHIG